MSFFENSAGIYGDDTVVPVCPSMIRWTAYKRACLTFFKGLRNFLHALSVSYNETREPEASGLFMQATSEQTIATILMLLEVFNCIKTMLFFDFYNSNFLIASSKQIQFYSLSKAIFLY